MIKLKLERTRTINTGDFNNEKITVGVEMDIADNVDYKGTFTEMTKFVNFRLDEASAPFGYSPPSVDQKKEPPLNVPTPEFKSFDSKKGKAQNQRPLEDQEIKDEPKPAWKKCKAHKKSYDSNKHKGCWECWKVNMGENK